MRSEWVQKRAQDPIRTQIHYARKGLVTEDVYKEKMREILNKL